MEDRRAERFEVVGEGIHPHCGGDRRRQSDSKLRVGDDRYRQHLRVEDDLLGMVSHIGDHRRAPDFGPGAGGGRHRDHRSDSPGVGPGPPVLPVFEVPQRAGLTRHQRHRLRRVEGAAAAESDHSVMSTVAPGPDAFGHVRLHRVRPHVGEDLAGEVGVAARLRRVRDHRHRREPRIGDQQWTFDSELAARLREFPDASGTEADRGWVVPVAVQGVRIDRVGHRRGLGPWRRGRTARTRILSQGLTFPRRAAEAVVSRRRSDVARTGGCRGGEARDANIGVGFRAQVLMSTRIVAIVCARREDRSK